MDSTPRYWFAAKRYGWGWGFPLTWEGWVTYAVWFAVLFGGLFTLRLHERGELLPHVIFILVMIAVLFAVCYWKGEPLRWRSGEE